MNKEDENVDSSTAIPVESSEGDGGTKCLVCKKRSARKNCLQSACIQCCVNPTCEPHCEAREALRKTQAILEGTDAITLLATQKRNSKVGKGAFKEPNIHYFGDTVTVWNIHEFMNVTKWRENAVRRSKRKFDSCDGGIIERRNGKRGRNERNNDEIIASLPSNKPKKSRRKKFADVCKVLLQNSLKNE